MKPKRVRLFSKSYCGWCHEAADWLQARGVPFEKIDIGANPAAREEMMALSGQGFVPVLEVDGQVLADFDTTQLEAFWKKHGLE